MSRSIRRVVWRVVAQSTPLVIRRCARCDEQVAFACSERFRVNAQGGRLDAWLIYRCTRCDARWNCAIYERTPVGVIAPDLLARLTGNDRELVWRFAFDADLLVSRGARPQGDVPRRVEQQRDTIAADGLDPVLEIVIELVHPCRVRLDRLLAEQLGLTRSAVARLGRTGALAVEPACRAALRRDARSGQKITIALRHPGRSGISPRTSEL